VNVTLLCIVTLSGRLCRLVPLTNATTYGSVMVLNHLFNGAELRVGHGEGAEVVRVIRGVPRTITCPGDAECLAWPNTPTAGPATAQR
jgi:hypothetical protein